jgi:hypothetical protein
MEEWFHCILFIIILRVHMCVLDDWMALQYDYWANGCASTQLLCAGVKQLWLEADHMSGAYPFMPPCGFMVCIGTGFVLSNLCHWNSIWGFTCFGRHIH